MPGREYTNRQGFIGTILSIVVSLLFIRFVLGFDFMEFLQQPGIVAAWQQIQSVGVWIWENLFIRLFDTVRNLIRMLIR